MKLEFELNYGDFCLISRREEGISTGPVPATQVEVNSPESDLYVVVPVDVTEQYLRDQTAQIKKENTVAKEVIEQARGCSVDGLYDKLVSCGFRPFDNLDDRLKRIFLRAPDAAFDEKQLGEDYRESLTFLVAGNAAQEKMNRKND